MRQCFYILLIFLFTDTIVAQKYQLINSKHDPDNSKNCSLIGNCISTAIIKNDTLYLTIFINNNGRDLEAYRDSFIYKNDTLSLILVDTNKIETTFRFNSFKNIIDTFYIAKMQIMRQLVGGLDFQRLQYNFIGFNYLPKVFQFDNENLCYCPAKMIHYEIYKGDTVNIIDKNGHRQNKWLTFYETGEIMKQKNYKDNSFVSGQYLNKSGIVIGEIEESEIETIIIPEDEK